MNSKKLKINLYGESWTLKKFECSSTELSSCLDIAKQMKLNIEEALLSPFFYYNLRLTSIPSLEYLPGKKISGLIDNPSNQIEIWFDGIRISKTAYTISGTTLTYIPANNGAYALVVGDRIQFDFSY